MTERQVDLRGEGFRSTFWKDGYINQIVELVKADADLFMGIRHGSFNIYYKSMSILKVEEAKSCFIGMIHKEYADKYVPLSKLRTGMKTETIEEIEADNSSKSQQYYVYNIDEQFVETFIQAVKDRKNGLKSAIDKHVGISAQDNDPLTYSNNARGASKVSYLEKVAQQAIIIKNNLNKESNWYCVDMEYCSPGLGFGRFDIVAISKDKNPNNKYDVSLIELKYGTGSYSGYSVKREYHNAYLEADQLYDNGRGDNKKKRRYYCQVQDNTIAKVNFGSGIVGHCYNFSQFLFQDNKESYHNLKKEICNILNIKKNLGFFKKTCCNFGAILEDDQIHLSDLEDKPLIFFLTVGCKDKSSEETLKQYFKDKTRYAATVSINKFLKESWNLVYFDGLKESRKLDEYEKNRFFSERLNDYIKFYFTEKNDINNLNELVQRARKIIT